MEKKQDNIWFVTLVLTVVAGYCDSITFVAADKIFSAHVTGNFIVFAYQMVNGAEGEAWIKLITFPVFMISVMAGGWIAIRFLNKHFILFLEGVLLIAGGILAYSLGFLDDHILSWPMYAVTMIVVFAMGLQNAFGKLNAKETYGPTTMMTGNVTQFALDIRNVLTSRFTDATANAGIFKGIVTLGGFLLGCVFGAYVGKLFGLVGIAIPGVAMVICYLSTKTSGIPSNSSN
ncbi:YoaK family protein [Pedobacter sp. AW1-32]|uniref:YoaK family protein n=1 Tax=Pedobacter sp. AW1-32 TaxID=3383026 RepID=UPI003FF019FC